MKSLAEYRIDFILEQDNPFLVSCNDLQEAKIGIMTLWHGISYWQYAAMVGHVHSIIARFGSEDLFTNFQREFYGGMDISAPVPEPIFSVAPAPIDTEPKPCCGGGEVK